MAGAIRRGAELIRPSQHTQAGHEIERRWRSGSASAHPGPEPRLGQRFDGAVVLGHLRSFGDPCALPERPHVIRHSSTGCCATSTMGSASARHACVSSSYATLHLRRAMVMISGLASTNGLLSQSPSSPTGRRDCRRDSPLIPSARRHAQAAQAVERRGDLETTDVRPVAEPLLGQRFDTAGPHCGVERRQDRGKIAASVA